MDIENLTSRKDGIGDGNYRLQVTDFGPIAHADVEFRPLTVFLARISQCAVERRAFLVGANPTQQLSFRLVAARAVHGGNDMD